MGERPASGMSTAVESGSEAIATTGLFLNIASVIALAMSLAGFGASNAGFAVAAGVSAVVTFVASLLCFRAQADDRGPQTV